MFFLKDRKKHADDIELISTAALKTPNKTKKFVLQKCVTNTRTLHPFFVFALKSDATFCSSRDFGISGIS